jgi:Fe-S oxidoreductase
MWKEEEDGHARVSDERFGEAVDSGADVLALGCPFCMVMMNDAKKEIGSDIEILDIAEIIVQGSKVQSKNDG